MLNEDVFKLIIVCLALVYFQVNYPAAKDGGASDPTNSPSLTGLTSGKQSAIPLVPRVLFPSL